MQHSSSLQILVSLVKALDGSFGAICVKLCRCFVCIFIRSVIIKEVKRNRKAFCALSYAAMNTKLENLSSTSGRCTILQCCDEAGLPSVQNTSQSIIFSQIDCKYGFIV